MSFKRCRSWTRLIVLLVASFLVMSALDVAVVAASPAPRAAGPGATRHLAKISRYVALRRAPRLAVSHKTLKWARVDRLNSYFLKSKAPGRPAKYTVVRGTSITPKALPGATVGYSVRTAVAGSAWAPETTISYTSSGGASGTDSGSSGSGTSAPSAPTPGAPGAAAPAPEALSTGTIEPSGPSSEAPGTGPTSSTLPSESLSEPFVEGVEENPDGWGEPAVAQVGKEVHELGAGWVRVDLPWKEVMPSPGVYDWSYFDKVVHNTEALGLHILPILGYAPSWTSPTDAAGYAQFVAAAVARYGPGTSANLQWFELWNEPYFSYTWDGKTPEPEAYARDVLAAAEASKKIVPSVKLLVAAEYADGEEAGGSSRWETSWVPDMFTAVPDLGKWIDGVAVHPYGDDPALPVAEPGGFRDASGEWSFQRIDTIHEQFLAHGVNVPFWITEVGWSTYNMSEAEQAHDYSDLIPQVAQRPWIRALFSYCLREVQEHPTDSESQTGLLKYGTWEPKPAFYTLQQGFKTLA
jgi:Cellulase (glycosyl hydrolase family 5)